MNYCKGKRYKQSTKKNKKYDYIHAESSDSFTKRDGISYGDSDFTVVDSEDSFDRIDCIQTNSKSFILHNANQDTIRKCFPINRSGRSKGILSKLSRLSSSSKYDDYFQNENGDFESMCPKEKVTLNRNIDVNLYNFPEFNKKFNAIFKSEDKLFGNENIDDDPVGFMPVYESITGQDLKDSIIKKYNWSGNDINISTGLYNSKVERVINSLNDEETDFWLSGFIGAFHLSRKYSRKLVESFIVDNL